MKKTETKKNSRATVPLSKCYILEMKNLKTSIIYYSDIVSVTKHDEHNGPLY
jgi:hypothetical protein